MVWSCSNWYADHPRADHDADVVTTAGEQTLAFVALGFAIAPGHNAGTGHLARAQVGLRVLVGLALC